MNFLIKKIFFFLSLSLFISIFFIPKADATGKHLKIISDEGIIPFFSSFVKREYRAKVKLKNISSDVLSNIQIEFVFDQSFSWEKKTDMEELLKNILLTDNGTIKKHTTIVKLMPNEEIEIIMKSGLYQARKDPKKISHKTFITYDIGKRNDDKDIDERAEIIPPNLLQKTINCIKNTINTHPHRNIIFIILILFSLLVLLFLIDSLYKAVIISKNRVITSPGKKNDKQAERIFKEVNNNSKEKNNKEKLWKYIKSGIQKFDLNQKILRDIRECLKGDGCKGTILSTDKKKLKEALSFFLEIINKNISELIKDSEEDLTKIGVGLIDDLYTIYSIFKEDDLIYYYFSSKKTKNCLKHLSKKYPKFDTLYQHLARYYFDNNKHKKVIKTIQKWGRAENTADVYEALEKFHKSLNKYKNKKDSIVSPLENIKTKFRNLKKIFLKSTKSAMHAESLEKWIMKYKKEFRRVEEKIEKQIKGIQKIDMQYQLDEGRKAQQHTENKKLILDGTILLLTNWLFPELDNVDNEDNDKIIDSILSNVLEQASTMDKASEVGNRIVNIAKRIKDKERRISRLEQIWKEEKLRTLALTIYLVQLYIERGERHLSEIEPLESHLLFLLISKKHHYDFYYYLNELYLIANKWVEATTLLQIVSHYNHKYLDNNYIEWSKRLLINKKYTVQFPSKDQV